MLLLVIMFSECKTTQLKNSIVVFKDEKELVSVIRNDIENGQNVYCLLMIKKDSLLKRVVIDNYTLMNFFAKRRNTLKGEYRNLINGLYINSPIEVSKEEQGYFTGFLLKDSVVDKIVRYPMKKVLRTYFNNVLMKEGISMDERNAVICYMLLHNIEVGIHDLSGLPILLNIKTF